MITVASYNMRKGIGTDRRRDPLRIIEVLHEIDADIVALQEADRRFRIQAERAAARSSRRAYAVSSRCPSTSARARSAGTAMPSWSASPPRHWTARRSPCRRWSRAAPCWPDVRIRGIDLRIIGMHLDLSGLAGGARRAAVISHARHSRGRCRPC